MDTKELYELGIVILHYNTPLDVAANLRAMQVADMPEKTEIVVVNNGGHNANDKIQKSDYDGLNVRFFDIPNKGFPQGNNFGIKYLNSKYIAIVNPDIEIRKNTLRVLHDYMEANQNIGIVAPQLIYPNDQIQDNYRVFPRPLDLFIKRVPFLRKRFRGRMSKYLMWKKDSEKNEAVDWVTGAFQVLTRKCWDAVGPNNEAYFLFMSDIEICWDAWVKGFEVHYVAQAKARHNESRLSEGGILDFFKRKTMRIHVKDAMIYFKKFLFKKTPKNSPSAKVK
ncbi:glycosyltransferase [Patescibacteria group bacterium]|nr:glycosyltransferase [Patescibacteria group bacterium]